ncbi:MAG: hypothetical protein V2J07_02840 [Anaerolineae bacterium]|nr:hypothetical protein [Anaerolineae bacterium]
MKRLQKFPIIFGVVCGIGMFAQWTLFIVTGQVPELQTEPYRIAFHLAAEGFTALGLIISSIILLKQPHTGKILYAIACGMLLYSVIVSPGYFAQLGQWEFVAMFAVLFILAILSLFELFYTTDRNLNEKA